MTREGMKAGRDQERQQDEPKKEKSLFQKIADGEAAPEGSQKGWLNLKEGQTKHNLKVIDPEKAKEIRRKGAEAVNQLKGEKRTAREALENILTLKASDGILSKADLDSELAERLKKSGINITMYDLLQLVAVGRAAGGNMKAYELIRDTYGDMPVKQIEVTENITTDADREMLRQINERLQQAETVQIVEAIPAAVPDDKEGGEIMTPDNDSMTE